ncbi:MAG: class I SAM-dependent methyltransferase, partial [Bacteriovoracaceae bacterium]|nr:class I SAM-dependent methyltransferase [Bacteriovoracaceae bacterium]
MILNPSFSQNSVSRHYDELSILYRKIWGEHLHHGLWLKGDEDRFSACDKLTEFVFSYLGDLEGREVLDIGCGYGASARVAENKGANITGITLSREQWEYARQRSNGHYILGDWNDCELKNESFDCGYSIECFSHVRDK